MTVRTRFAPSPTGYLHIGGARTALFSWLYARRHNGKFVLRIEDTDRERSTQEAVEVILEGMQWLGLDHDEGPFYQTERMDRYKEVIQQLLADGYAYHCYCSKEELDVMREAQMANKEKARYDRRCRDLEQPPEGKEAMLPVIRFKTNIDGEVLIKDHVKGQIVIKNKELDDLIIARGDGTPTYNLVVVIDDLDMGITHVIRGDDHLNNTPRQINILKAMNAAIPEYAHLPMILDEKGAKLSKRHGAANLLNYREEGYLPEALLNYLVRLGWSHGDQEIFSIAEMIELFDLDDINKSASSINPDKLLWLNQHYIKEGDPEHVAKHLAWHMDHAGINTDKGPRLSAIVTALAERSKTLVEMAQSSRYFFEDFAEFDEKAAKKNLKAAALEPLQQLLARFTAITEWQGEALHQMVLDLADELELKLGKVAQPLRVAITGAGMSPSIDVTLELVGRERCLNRIAMAIDYIEARVAAQ
ncbi:glutamate--tRNA ligase [sulfur-oxidizing endosymbiont of Gigantopelta aegis]|uniref:glutamate--tRNA ligase n=1 Tax=sulfur-oxidizing endosymbiont of Gigantopelta aegis TaxID=2794934 RepID=UPI0018DBC407|nr:glutamate--tRNA ligase [sulfur-oxidizing endosymbiont of Gigantopelta aegis]